VTGATLADALSGACERYSERTALVDPGRTMTYAELGTAVASLAAAYRRLGIERGDRVVCPLPNGVDHFVAVGAAWAAGAVHVAADAELTAAELDKLVALTGAAMLLRPGDVERLTDGVAAAAPSDGPGPADVAAIFTTSGSTGTPKLPLGMHGKLHGSWTGLSGALGFTPDDVHLVQLPLSHGFGLMLATAGLVRGGRLVIEADFTGAGALATIEHERVTVLNGTPAHYRLLIDRLRDDRRDCGSLRIGVAAGAAFSPALLETVFGDLGMDELMLMYGSSEGVGVATTDRAEMLAGSVGCPDPPGSVAIVDPATGDRLPAGEVGEIAFAREFNPIRYWGGAPPGGATGSGWFHSGDLGRIDDAGRLYVLGRAKHQISRGGMEIDPAEVEEALLRCGGVADAAAVGVPNPFLDEVVCACVVPATARAPALGDLRAELGPRLASFKLPEEMCVLQRIPRTAIGKVDVALLRAEALAAPRQSVRA
jgi:acyl-CoA synthetase (AMP-forming)/AMP-acid ligase II